MALLGAPIAAHRLLARWSSAAERRCDREAAAILGDPTVVAAALVAMGRLACGHPPAAAAFTPARDEIAVRVEALLSPTPADPASAARLRRATLVGATALVAALVFLSVIP
jgi:Zn-dependent protease with chaperone function